MELTTPYLVQRAEIKRPLAPASERLAKTVKFDYMGSAEFEYGAIPKAFRGLKAMEKLTVRKVPEIMDGERQLRVLSGLDDEQFAAYCNYLLKMRAGNIDLKESSRFEEGRVSDIDFWWDIQNNVMWSFDKIFMNRANDYLKASFLYMDQPKV